MNVDFDTFSKSQRALSDYMHWESRNEYMHRARVLVSKKGQLKVSDEMTIIPRIEANCSTITIINANSDFERDYYSRYSNEYQEFSFSNGTLRITGEDRWGNSIEVDITSI